MLIVWGIIDPVLTPVTYIYTWVNRAIIVSILLLCWGSTFTKLYYRFTHPILVLGIFAFGMLNVAAVFVNLAWTQVAILSAIISVLVAHTLMSVCALFMPPPYPLF